MYSDNNQERKTHVIFKLALVREVIFEVFFSLARSDYYRSLKMNDHFAFLLYLILLPDKQILQWITANQY